MKLLNIDEFIKKVNAYEVKTSDVYLKNSNKLHPEGIYSEEIFGRIGTEKRLERFGYIDLGHIFIHPEVISDIRKFIPKFSKWLDNKVEIGIDTNTGEFVAIDKGKEIPSNVKIINNFKELKEVLESGEFNWDKAFAKDDKTARFLKDNLNLIFITKWLVLPAGYRDIFETNKGYQEKDLSKAYKALISKVNTLKALLNPNNQSNSNNSQDNIEDKLKGELASALLGQDNNNTQNQNQTQDSNTTINELIKEVQKYLIFVDRKLKDDLRGKNKYIRGSKLSKRVDHSARLVLAHDNNLNSNEVKIPWFILLKLYEPFIIYYISNDPRFSDLKENVQNKFGKVSVDSIKDYISYIVQYPKTVDSNVKERLIEILDIVISGKEDNTPKYVMVLRHPVENRNSVLGLKPVIDKSDTYVAKLPQVLFSTLGADCSWDEITVRINNEKIITCHIRDLLKYVEHYDIVEFTREDGVHVKMAHLKDKVEVIAYDRENKKFVVDIITTWHEHKNIKMNKLVINDTKHIMSPHKETLVTVDGNIVKPDKSVIDKKVMQTITIKDLDILNRIFGDGLLTEQEIIDNYWHLLYFIGMYFGDGALDNKNEISFTNISNNMVNIFEYIGKELFKRSVRKYKHHKATRCGFTHAKLANRIRKYLGKGAKYKNPFIIVNKLSEYAKSIVIAGYIDSDGHLEIPKYKQEKLVLRVETINENLVRFLKDYFEGGVIKKTKLTSAGNQCYRYRKIIAKRNTKYKDLMVLSNLKHEFKVERAKFIFENTLNKLNTIKSIEETDIDIGWDISTLYTGTYVDKYGFVKKQCDGDIINIYALHTKPAIEEIKKIDPVEGELGAFSVDSYNTLKVDFAMDMALSAYELTKNPPENK